MKRKATIVMFVAIIILWTSTAAYWIVTIVVAVRVSSTLRDITAQNLDGVANVQACLLTSWSFGNSSEICTLDVPDALEFFRQVSWIRDYSETVTLTISVSPSAVENLVRYLQLTVLAVSSAGCRW